MRKGGDMSDSRPPGHYEIRFDLGPVLDYLSNVLDPGLVDKDAPGAVLNLLVASTVDLTRNWKDNNQLEEAISYLVNAYGFDEKFVHDICRIADNMVTSILLSFDPLFGGDHYYGQISHAIYYDDVLCLYLKKEAFNHE